MTKDFNRARTGPSGLLPSFFAMLACLGVAACADRNTGSTAVESSESRPAVAGTELPDVLATIGDEQITLDDVCARAGDQLDQMTNRYLQQRHELLDETLQRIVRDRLLGAEAEKRGISVNELIEDETGTNLEVTDVDIAAWYEENKSRMQGRTLDQVRDQIADHLRTTRRNEALTGLEERLSEEYGVTYHLEPFRVALDNEGAPALGPSDAAVTLVEFSDFECPYCSRFFPTLERIKESYGDRIRIVYRQFPLTNLHPSAFKAAEASLCAYEQGEFWAFHDLLFQEQDRLAVRDLKEKAGRLGLDQNDFNTCLDAGRYVEQVQDDLAAGRTVGVTGTPALFVNGIPIEGGAVAFEVVADVLDEELRRAGG
jgi:predicted DsbA family dithiol-disulfide isomerase